MSIGQMHYNIISLSKETEWHDSGNGPPHNISHLNLHDTERERPAGGGGKRKTYTNEIKTMINLKKSRYEDL